MTPPRSPTSSSPPFTPPGHQPRTTNCTPVQISIQQDLALPRGTWSAPSSPHGTRGGLVHSASGDQIAPSPYLASAHLLSRIKTARADAVSLPPSEHEEAASEEQGTPEQGLSPRGKTLLFVLLCFMVTTFSGGVMLGVGPLENAMAAEGYFAQHCEGRHYPCTEQFNQMSSMFNGGFQIMTGGSILAAWLSQYAGPRVIAICGCCCTIMGAAGFSALSKDCSVQIFMLFYGLIAVGNNCVFISLFQFTALYNNREICCSVLAGLYNGAGCLFMLLIIPGFSTRDFFQGYSFYGVAMLVVVLLIFPPVPYQKGDHFKIFPRTGSSMRPGSKWEEDGLAQSRLTRSPSTFIGHRSTNFQNQTVGFTLHKPRFWWFCITFSWSALSVVMIGGYFSVIAQDKDPANAVSMVNYAFPLIGNGTYLFAPLVGYLISSRGFYVAAFLMVLVTQLMMLACYIPGPTGLYTILVFYCFAQAIIYTFQYSYVTITFPPAIYSPLLAITMLVQGVCGFVAWPTLSPNPFGTTQYNTALLFVLVPSVVLYWFAIEQYPNDVFRKSFLNCLLEFHNIDRQSYDSYVAKMGGRLDRETCKLMVRDMLATFNVHDPSDEDLRTIVEKIFDIADTNGDGELQFDEMQKVLSAPEGPWQRMAEITETRDAILIRAAEQAASPTLRSSAGPSVSWNLSTTPEHTK